MLKSGFLQFSSDIETASSMKNGMKFSEPIPLGGGEFTFDMVKSGGLLRIQNETEGYMRTTIVNGTIPVTSTNLLRFSNYSYEPVNNFWQDQGYEWSYGNVNVTKGALTTPLQYTSMDSVTYGLTGTLFDLDTIPASDGSPACSLMDVYTVNITPDTGNLFASGNGNGMLELESTVTSQQFANATNMTVSVNPDLPEGFQGCPLGFCQPAHQ